VTEEKKKPAEGKWELGFFKPARRLYWPFAPIKIAPPRQAHGLCQSVEKEWNGKQRIALRSAEQKQTGRCFDSPHGEVAEAEEGTLPHDCAPRRGGRTDVQPSKCSGRADSRPSFFPGGHCLRSLLRHRIFLSCSGALVRHLFKAPSALPDI